MTEPDSSDPPSPFIERWARALLTTVPPARRALDVAMGRGRHAIVLAREGYRVFGVDLKRDSVHDAAARTAAEGWRLRAWCADLTASPLPYERFELVVVVRYLQRDLFPALIRALAPGGVLLYETFTEAQRANGRRPRSPEHLLRAGELRARTESLETLFYEEVTEPDALARLVGRKASSRS
jgi:SAM-dependent methyltransferase